MTGYWKRGSTDTVYWAEQEGIAFVGDFISDSDMAHMLERLALEIVHATLTRVRNALHLLEEEEWVDEGGQKVIWHMLNELPERG